MNKNFIYFFILIFILFSTEVKSQETSCEHVEKEPISNGYPCYNDILYFTSNIDTLVEGEIFANDVIFITPTSNHTITLKPKNYNCNNCVEPGDGNGTTIKSRGSGGGKTKSNKIITPSENLKIQSIKVKKNPVKDILELDISENISISNIEIYDSSGKFIKQSANLNKDHKINCSTLSNGKYWISISTTENKKYLLNFIKN